LDEVKGGIQVTNRALFIGLGAFGIILLILGILWLTVIFPSLEKVPSDYERDYTFTGNYSSLNQSTMQMDVIPVILTRELRGNGTASSCLVIDQTITHNPPIQPVDFSQLKVDAKTRKYVPECYDNPQTAPREQWSPPGHLEEEEDFMLWSPSTMRPVNVTYLGKEEYEGITVFNYEGKAEDVSLGDYIIDTFIELKVEPLSGVPVGQHSITSRSMEMAPGMVIEVFVSDIEFGEESVEYLVDLAKDSKTKIQWFGSYVPWILICFGIVLVVVSAAVILRNELK
jgi:hypothetical protein